METGEELITFSIDPQVFWGLVALTVFGIVLGLTLTMIKVLDPGENWLARLKANLGLKNFNTGLFLIGVLFWSVIFGLLALGLVWLIWELIWRGLPVDDADIWNWRFGLAKLTALVATLGAVVALPITLQRLRLTRQQTNLTAEALLNDKINAAAGDLHARRLVTMNPGDMDGRWDYHQDDIIKRNAAIDRLFGLAEESPDIAPRIARMLSIYVRELSRENPPQKVPKDSPPGELRSWAGKLTACRSDMENAAQTLGRLQGIDGVDPTHVQIDLREANLQAFDLHHLSLKNALLSGAEMQGAGLLWAEMQGVKLFGAKMQGAKLSWAKMQRADLGDAKMQGADLSGAKMQRAYLCGAKMQEAILFKTEMQGAYLSGVEMQGTNLSEAEMQGVDLSGAEMDSATSLTATNFQAAAVRLGDYTDVRLKQSQVDWMFYDGSATFAPDIKRAPGREAVLGLDEFDKQWRAWQKSTGDDPKGPEG